MCVLDISTCNQGPFQINNCVGMMYLVSMDIKLIHKLSKKKVIFYALSQKKE